MASRILSVALLAASATQVLASCAYGTHLMPRAEEGGAVPINTFGYAGAIGPLNWVSLDPQVNIACGTGTRQSPIDMVAGQFNMIPGGSIGLQIPDMLEGTEFENLGTTVEVIAQGGTITVGGITHTLQQFHFHLPSEHLDNGTSQAMEMHMVWEGPAGQIAVIGVYIDLESGAVAPAPVAAPVAAPEAPAKRRGLDREARRQAAREQVEKRQDIPLMATAPVVASVPVASALLETVFTSLSAITVPGTKTKTQPLVMSDLVALLTAGTFQGYSGSLTTPPCSEGVQWLVSTQKLQVQTATFEAVRDVIGFNSRFPQNTLGQANLLQVASASLSSAGIQAPVGVIPAPPK